MFVRHVPFHLPHPSYIVLAHAHRFIVTSIFVGMVRETGGEGRGGGSAAGALSIDFCVALGYLGPPCRSKTGCHWRSGRMWTLRGRRGRLMVVGVARELCWGCLAMTRSAGLWPASGDGVGHPGSISGAFRRPNMVVHIFQRSSARGAADRGIADSFYGAGGPTESPMVEW